MKLIAHRIHPQFEIRPARLERAWMDATPDKYAYRCLPLNIANMHGWYIPCPVGFSCYWDGSPGAEGVHILSDAPGDLRASSLFGAGVITFPVPFLFRTEPGVHLYTSGLANVQKDGIAPLSGIIETDWSPFTFTMNWRLTRPNHVVHFAAGEPYCVVFPIQLGLIEATEPEIVPLEADPELHRTFTQWRENRVAFYDRIARDSDDRVRRSWQRDYFNPQLPADTDPAIRHRTKLRVRPFRDGQPNILSEAADHGPATENSEAESPRPNE